MKKIYRSRRNQMIGGVCMGIARYFDVDVTLVRLVWALAAFLGGSGVLAYFIAWIIIPEEPMEGEAIDVAVDDKSGINADSRTIGLIIVGVGVYMLVRQFLPITFMRFYFWPIFIIIIGVFILMGSLGGGRK
jgi:phage shock protein C